MYPSTESILVPVDFSEQSMIALEQSYNIARLVNARIILLHVITGKLTDQSESKGFIDDLDGITDKLNKLSRNVEEESSVECSFSIEKGRIVPSILEVARSSKARFIFIGTRMHTIGPVTMRIIKEAPCPVVSIKGKYHRRGCRRIILPLDLSKSTTQKVHLTLNLARYFQSQVNVVSATSPSKDFKLTKIRLLLEQVRDFFVNHNIHCTTKLLDMNNRVDNVANTLLDYADDVDGDLIVIMIQQENSLKEKIIGSLARKVIMGSNIPVMCVKPNTTENL
ncbi:MAG: universal stress protein [Bacteroidales bacterium]